MSLIQSKQMFQLIETIELLVELTVETKLIRVEIFESANKNGFFRTRIWLQNIYDVYPTMLNHDLNRVGNERIYSSELLNVDITLSVAESPEWMTGIPCDCKEDFFNMIQSRVLNFFEELG